uniref:Ribonuclease HII n=1 Tax=viral metagenome TaxID=1070528 RepID=A0A6C0KWF9_9ZZZZ
MLLLPNDIIEIGVDEVGRGTLFGPVVAAAVILAPISDANSGEYEKIMDSKKISEKKREKIATFIHKEALAVGIGMASAAEIDEINILQATYLAMHRALDNIAANTANTNIVYDLIRVDGNKFKPYKDKKYECVVQGDAKYLSIAAASIVAKVYRDNFILENVATNSNLKIYDLQNNKGYGTAKHLAALKTHGPVEGHRFSFKPISQ